MKLGMNPDWEKEIEKAVAPALEAIAERRTQQYRELGARHEGGDVEAVKIELMRIYSEDGGEITEPELAAHAEAIVSGYTITFRA